MGVYVVSAGMVTSLGLDWQTSCAASRAGISRAATLDYFRYRTPDTGELKTAVGHEVKLLTNGFEGYVRLVQLLAGAMRDLIRNTANPVERLSRVRFFLSLPDPARMYSTPELFLDEASREQYRAVRDEARSLAAESKSELPRKILEEARRLANWPGKPVLAGVSWAGHAGTAAVLKGAALALGNSEIVVGGLDSLLEEETLTWLLNTGRLKTPAIAAGLIPGEAAALFLISPSRDDAAAEIQRIEQSSEEKPLADGVHPDGRSLATAIASAAAPNQDVSIYSDHNGESYRGAELGWTLARLRASRPELAQAEIRYPAISFGDTGAASGAVALARAVSDFERLRSSTRVALIASSSERSERAAVLVRSAG